MPTPDNFGAAGQPPSHPELLDTLAVDFMADGWSIKRLIRRIVLSRAYGLDSAHDAQQLRGRPRQHPRLADEPRRLEAEALRDALLFVSGRLAPEPPVGSAVARAGEGLALFVRGDGLDASDTHRSVYLPVVRDQVLESLALFDFADPSLVTGERADDDRPGPGALLHERPVRDPAGRGAWPSGSAPSRATTPAGSSGRIGSPSRGRRPTAERDRALAFLRRTFAAGATDRRPTPGRRSARRSSPAPSSGTSIDRVLAPPSEDRSR